MSYIGKTPTPAPLTSSDITDGIISTSKLADTSVTNAKLNADLISAETELATAPADTDELLISDAGVLKRIDASLVGGGGITMADQWRLSSHFSGSGDITTNLERSDSLLQNYLGSGMSQSSGIFTFPSTGYYHVIGTFELDGGANDSYMAGQIYVTNNNSSYSLTALARGGIAGNTGTDPRTSTTCFSLLDITDTTQQKVKFNCDNANGIAVGSSSYNRTHFTFIRLGDT